jgi:hypothetical protein
MGQHKYYLGRFNEAINTLSFYVNLYPADEKIKEVFLLLANSYKQAAQVSSALVIYNLIIDKYPESKEAQESILAMASLGADKPGEKIFSALNNIHYYKDPIDAYNTLLMKNPSEEIAQTALLQKGEALHKLKHGGKAAETYLEFINLYPQSKRIDSAKRGLKMASGALIDGYFLKKDYLGVADIYYKAYRAVPLQDDELETINKIARSLKELNLTEDYVRLLRDYKNVCKDEKNTSKILLDIAEGEMARAQYDEAEKILNELTVRPAIKKTALISVIKNDLAEIAYRKGLYDKAIGDFNSVINSSQAVNDPGSTYMHYADALKRNKDNPRALQSYLIAVKYLSQNGSTSVDAVEAYKETGDLYFNSGNYKDSLNMYNKSSVGSSNVDLKYWSLFNAGRSHMKMENNAEAQKTFARIRTEAGPEGFWTKVVNYHVDDQKWWGKYGEYLRR